jgi:putative FmdB family regulatory protein
MPIYEYNCKACGHEVEALQKISDKPLRKCPECGRLQLQRLISAPVFRLKGGGWYETDFKSDKEKKRNIAGDGADKSSAEKSGSENKSDTKGGSEKAASGDKKASSGSDKGGKSGSKGSSSAVA